MAARSVFALASGRYELFLGYTQLDSDEPRTLLEDVMSRFSSARAQKFSVLQRMGGGSVFVFAKSLQADDPVLDANRRNAHLHNGGPYIHDLAYLDPTIAQAGGGEAVVELREADNGIPVTLANGQTLYCAGSDGTHSIGMADGTTELI